MDNHNVTELRHVKDTPQLRTRTFMVICTSTRSVHLSRFIWHEGSAMCLFVCLVKLWLGKPQHLETVTPRRARLVKLSQSRLTPRLSICYWDFLDTLQPNLDPFTRSLLPYLGHPSPTSIEILQDATFQILELHAICWSSDFNCDHASRGRLLCKGGCAVT